ncbi:MAG TPA: hypothetical protein VFN68_01790 [Acidimicrobiales bacterium]|nr:hypothetical protein [Acidimicrobiales bacterium]
MSTGVALVTTMGGVIGVLAAMALLLWFSAYMESRHLGPLIVTHDGGTEAAVVPIEGSVAAATDPLTSAA